MSAMCLYLGDNIDSLCHGDRTGFAILSAEKKKTTKHILNAPFNQADQENELICSIAAVLCSSSFFPVSFGVLWPTA